MPAPRDGREVVSNSAHDAFGPRKGGWAAGEDGTWGGERSDLEPPPPWRRGKALRLQRLPRTRLQRQQQACTGGPSRRQLASLVNPFHVRQGISSLLGPAAENTTHKVLGASRNKSVPWITASALPGDSGQPGPRAGGHLRSDLLLGNKKLKIARLAASGGPPRRQLLEDGVYLGGTWFCLPGPPLPGVQATPHPR